MCYCVLFIVLNVFYLDSQPQGKQSDGSFALALFLHMDSLKFQDLTFFVVFYKLDIVFIYNCFKMFCF